MLSLVKFMCLPFESVLNDNKSIYDIQLERRGENPFIATYKLVLITYRFSFC